MQQCFCPDNWCETCPYRNECSHEGKQEVKQDA
jgi:hypothetical protein